MNTKRFVLAFKSCLIYAEHSSISDLFMRERLVLFHWILCGEKQQADLFVDEKDEYSSCSHTSYSTDNMSKIIFVPFLRVQIFFRNLY